MAKKKQKKKTGEQAGVCRPGQWPGGVHVWIPFCLPAAGFCIRHKQPVKGLHEGDNMGGSGEVEDEACCSVLDELQGLERVWPQRELQ